MVLAIGVDTSVTPSIATGNASETPGTIRAVPSSLTALGPAVHFT
jgi:hypothetical protein